MRLRAEAYWEALADCSIAEIEAAAAAAIKEEGRHYMPAPGELIEHVQVIRFERHLKQVREAMRVRTLASAPPTTEEAAEVRKVLDELNAKLHWR